MSARNVLVLTYWSYRDALIQTYTLPYVRMMRKCLGPHSKLTLVTLEQERLELTSAARKATQRELEAEGIHWIPLRYSRFGAKVLMKWVCYIVRLTFLCYFQKMSQIHAFATPAGAAAYLLSLLTGVPLVIDSYEPHADSMIENGTWKEGGAAFAILSRLERLQSRRAKAVIATTEGMREYSRRRYGVDIQRFYVKPACVDLEAFSEDQVKNAHLLEHYQLQDKIVCVYAGKIGGIYLEREIFDFFKVASNYWGESFRVILLTGSEPEKVRHMAQRSKLDPNIMLVKFVEHRDIPRYIGLGDFAINPVKPVPSKRLCTSIKDGEYWAIGLPVVIPWDISDDSEIIARHKIGAVLKEFTLEGYHNAVAEIDSLLRGCDRKELRERIRSIAVRYRSFANAERIYQELYGTKAG